MERYTENENAVEEIMIINQRNKSRENGTKRKDKKDER